MAAISPGDHHEQRAFAATAWAQYAEKLPIADIERHLADRFEIAIAFLERGDPHVVASLGSLAARSRARSGLGVGTADGIAWLSWILLSAAMDIRLQLPKRRRS